MNINKTSRHVTGDAHHDNGRTRMNEDVPTEKSSFSNHCHASLLGTIPRLYTVSKKWCLGASFWVLHGIGRHPKKETTVDG